MKNLRKEKLNKSFRNFLLLIPMMLFGNLINGQVSFNMSTYDCNDFANAANTSNIIAPVYYEWGTPGYSTLNMQNQTSFSAFYPVGSHTITLNAYSDSAMTNLIGTSSQGFTLTTNVIANAQDSIISQNCDSTTIQFYGFDANATSYAWSFTDGQTSSLANPILTFDNSLSSIIGTELMVSDSICSESDSLYIPIGNNLCDSVDFTLQVDSDDCDSSSVYGSNTSIIATSPVYYEWVPTGNPHLFNLNSSNFSITYYVNGNYSITLNAYSDPTFTNLIGSKTKNFTINHTVQGVASFTYNILSANCSSSQVQLFNTTPGTVYSYWTNNGQFLSNAINPIVTLNTGVNNIYLSAQDSICSNVLDSAIVILGNNLSANPQDSIISQDCDSATIQFYGYDANATSYYWYFHDGQTSTLANPILTFDNANLPGFADLTISDGTCSDSDSLFISISSTLCDSVDFTIQTGNFWTCDSSIVYFQNTSSLSTSPVYYEWTYSGSTFSYGSVSSLEFYNNGTYFVTLNAYSDNTYTNLIGTKTQSFIVNHPHQGVASFTYNILNANCSNPQVQLFNTTPGITNTYWTNNGQYLSNATNPIVTLNSGINNISLSSQDSICSNILDSTIFIPGNSLVASPQDSIISETCDSTTILFYGFDVNATSYNWYFHDGQTSTQSSTMVTFDNASLPGFADLTISDGFCLDSDSLFIDLNIPAGCESTSSCSYELTLFDSFGDGWNGNSLNVYINGVLSGNYTFTNNMNGGTSFSFPLNIISGDLLTFQFDNSGNWSNECSWELKDAEGSLVLSENAILSTTVVGPIAAACNDFDAVVSSTISSYINCDNYNVSFTASPIGGTANYTYLWSYNGSSFTGIAPTITVNKLNPIVTVLITDAAGLTSTQTIEVVFFNDLSISASYQNNSSNLCSADSCEMEITISSIGGSAPYQYSIDNGATFIASNSFNNLCAGYYNIVVTDALGCIASTNLLIDSLQSLVINLQTSTPTCDSTDYLYARAYPSNGSGNYSYTWSNGVTNYSLGGWSSQITLGAYNVIVTDNVTGCTASATANLYQACNSVSGNVYVDYNGNCIVDSNDHLFVNSYSVNLEQGTTWTGLYDYVFSSDNGHYTIYDVPNGTYDFDVSGYNIGNYTLNCSPSITVNSNNPNSVMDLFITPPPPAQDLRIYMHRIWTVNPGFFTNVRTVYVNDGTIPMDGYVEFTYDANLVYNGTYPGNTTPDVVDLVNHTLRWNFTNLLPGQSISVMSYFDAPVTLALGTPIYHSAVVEPITGDLTPSNNIAYLQDSCVASRDPNDKTVYPAGNITVDEKDHAYHINFQNEGTANTTFVIVEDNLDESLDINSLRNVSASHNFVMTIEDIDKLVFTFNNLHLTPKAVDEPNSKGHIDFTISQKANLPIGTVIENTAEIYFDFNEAIITNTTQNEIVEKTTAIDELELLEEISIYPNPSTGMFHVTTENGNQIQAIEVFDVLGKKVFNVNEMSTEKAMINLQKTATGVYIIKLKTDKGLVSKRVIIQKD